MKTCRPVGFERSVAAVLGLAAVLAVAPAQAATVTRAVFGTSADGEFTLIEEECLAACANAPCMISGQKYFLDLTPQSAVAALDEIKQMPPDHAPPRGKNHGRHAGDSHDDEVEHS